MATFRITAAELARDGRAVLEKIERGNEVIIEREDHCPLAVMKQPERSRRKISEMHRVSQTSGREIRVPSDAR